MCFKNLKLENQSDIGQCDDFSNLQIFGVSLFLKIFALSSKRLLIAHLERVHCGYFVQTATIGHTAYAQNQLILNNLKFLLSMIISTL